MKTNSKSFKLKPNKYLSFLNEGSLILKLEDFELKRKKKANEFISKDINISFEYDSNSEKVIINYSIKEEEKIDEVKLHYIKKDIEKNIELLIKQESDTPYTKKNFIKISIGITFFALILWATFNFAFSADYESVREGFDKLFGNFSWWTTFPLIDIIMPGLFSAVAFTILFRVIFDKKINFFILWLAFYVGFFIDQVSPIYGPGTVFSMYIIFKLQKTKLRASEIGIAGLMYGNIGNMTSVLFSSFSLISFIPYINSLPFETPWIAQVMYGFAWAGMSILALNIFFYFLIAYSIKTQKLISWGIGLFFRLLKKEDKIEKLNYEILFQAKRLKTSTSLLWSKVYIFPLLLVINLFGWMWGATSTWVIKNSINPDVMSWTQSFLTDVMINVTGIAIPSPGNAGFSEIFMNELYYAIVKFNDYPLSKPDVEAMVIVQRSVGHYSKTFGSGITLVLSGVFIPIYLKKKKN